MKINSAQNVWC